MEQIDITVDQNGILRYSKPVLRVFAGTTVRWICQTHDYAIQFANGTTPFETRVGLLVGSLSQSKGQPTEDYRIKALKTAGVPETYKYTVAVHDSARGRILMDDPIIIIDDESSAALR